MNKAIAAMGVGLLLAAGPASARTKYRPYADPAAAPQSHVNSGWGPPRTWDEIEISHPEGGG